jgi:hypothetical protein
VNDKSKNKCARGPEQPASARVGLNFGFRFAQARYAVSLFPLPALLEQLDALKAFQNVSFRAGRAGRAQTAML